MSSYRLEGPGVITELHFGGPVATVVGSSLVIAEYCGRLLMIYSKVRHGWEFPGGKAFIGEEAEKCALREFREETGLILKDLSSLCTFHVNKVDEAQAGTIFTSSISGFSPKLNSSEILGIGLFSELPLGISIKDGYVELMFEILLGRQR